MTAEDKEKCAVIMEHYGMISQINILVEECAELIQAAQKLKRLEYKSAAARRNFVEELADVSIMIQQMLSPDDAPVERYQKTITEKLNRQLQRIAAEREKE